MFLFPFYSKKYVSLLGGGVVVGVRRDANEKRDCFEGGGKKIRASGILHSTKRVSGIGAAS